MPSYVRFGSAQHFFPGNQIFRKKKAWGEEQWIVNKEYCGKKLILKKNHRCSMHAHKKKDEVFYLQSGKALLELDGKSYEMKPGDFVHIKTGMPHRFTGLEDCEIMEFSTTHDEDDSFRSELSGHVEQDRYDRESAIIKRFPKASVLVLGDVMLDTYTSGDVTRISPEAPIPVVRFKNKRHVPGGAANAAANVASLGGKVTLLGVTGKDAAATTLVSLLKKSGVRSILVADATRATTEKHRIVAADAHQLVRIDSEHTHSLTPALEKKLLSLLSSELPKHQALLLSDYAKGVFSPGLLKACVAAARRLKVPVILDPKPQGPEYLAAAKGVTLITPNRGEAQMLSKAKGESMTSVATKIARALSADVLCTLGGEGMLLVSAGKTQTFPVLAKGVVDVSGAGDTVASTLALAFASKASIDDAVDLANRAASIVVEKAGTATVSPEELLRTL